MVLIYKYEINAKLIEEIIVTVGLTKINKEKITKIARNSLYKFKQ